MKTIVALFLACFTVAAFGQAPPILRHGFTTNVPNANQFSGNAIKSGALLTNTSLTTPSVVGSATFDLNGLIYYTDSTDSLVLSNAFHANSVRLADGNLYDLNGNRYVTNSTGIDGGGGSGIPTLNGSGTNTTIRTNLFFGSGGISNNTVDGTIVIYPTNGSTAYIYLRDNQRVGINTTNTISSGLDVYGGFGVTNQFSSTAASFNGNIDSYLQLNVKNFNTDSSASSDLVATAGHGTETNWYVNMGINGPNGGGHPFTNGGHAYFYSQGSNNRPHVLNIGAIGSNSSIAFSAGAPIVGASGSATNPVVRMVIATNGNVGIGTATPGVALEVVGGVTASGNITTSRLLIDSGTGIIDTTSGAILSFQDAATAQRMAIRQKSLVVGTNGGENAMFRVKSDTNEVIASFDSQLGVPVVTITSNSLVGIDTTTPLSKLHASNSTAQVAFRLDQNLTTNAIELQFSAGTLIRATETNGPASYSTQATNELVATGYTNTTGVNMQAMVNATAVSFTVNNRAGTVIYTSPVITGVMPIGLQPGWSVRGASGLAGTVIPGL